MRSRIMQAPLPVVADIHLTIDLDPSGWTPASQRCASTRETSVAHSGSAAGRRRSPSRHPDPHRRQRRLRGQRPLSRHEGEAPQRCWSRARCIMSASSKTRPEDIIRQVGQVPVMVRAYQILSERVNYLLHLGVTEGASPGRRPQCGGVEHATDPRDRRHVARQLDRRPDRRGSSGHRYPDRSGSAPGRYLAGLARPAVAARST